MIVLERSSRLLHINEHCSIIWRRNMHSEDIIVYAVPLAVFLASLFISFAFGKNRFTGGLVVIGLLWLGFTVAMFFGMEASPGLDGLGYLVGLIGLSVPVGIGALLGGLVGWFRKENSVDA
jgi:hypothetical protein